MVASLVRMRLALLCSGAAVCFVAGCSAAREPAAPLAASQSIKSSIERPAAESAATPNPRPLEWPAVEKSEVEVVSAEFDAPPPPEPPRGLEPARRQEPQERTAEIIHASGSGPSIGSVPPVPDEAALEQRPEAGLSPLPTAGTGESTAGKMTPTTGELAALEQIALTQNPELARLQHSYGAALARSNYADQLPDPTVMANVFGNPLETAAGSQRANFTVSQVIPWLGRLNAREQSQLLDALAVHAEYRAARLRVVADVRTTWYQLFVSARQIETTLANQELLESLIKVANARVATGAATQGDVLLGTLELSRLEEQLLTFRQQEVSFKATLNRLLGRSAASPVASPEDLNPELPEWTHSQLVDLAQQHQPEIDAARLRTQASRWGIEVARLSRRPDFMLSSSWFATDDNRPASTVVNVGENPWNAGIRVSIPLWDQKYDAMEQEAVARHLAAHSSVARVRDQYDALLRDLWEQARTAAETAALYEETILPQARQTLDADQQSYANGNVDFERIVRDFRNVLTLELGHHQAIGRLAIALARIEQAVGTEHVVPAR